MPKEHKSAATVNEITVDPRPTGARAVYLIETCTAGETREIENLFVDLTAHVEICPLSSGKLISYVVQAHESDSEILDEIEEFLNANYGFVMTHRSFDPLIHRIVTELCADTDSRILPLPRCNICGNTEPFPRTVVSLAAEDGSVLAHRHYCASCTAQVAAPNNKQFILALLDSDERDFRALKQAELVRHPSRKRPIRFKVQ